MEEIRALIKKLNIIKQVISVLTWFNLIVTFMCLILLLWVILTPVSTSKDKITIKKAGKAVEYEDVIPIPKTKKGSSELLGEFRVTAYCPCYECNGAWGEYWGSGVTSTGVFAEEGRTIAVDPKIIPYGSLVYIDGIGYRRAEDTGAAIQGNSLDVYFNKHKDAWKFGVQYLKVYIIRTEE